MDIDRLRVELEASSLPRRLLKVFRASGGLPGPVLIAKVKEAFAMTIVGQDVDSNLIFEVSPAGDPNHIAPHYIRISEPLAGRSLLAVANSLQEKEEALFFALLRCASSVVNTVETLSQPAGFATEISTKLLPQVAAPPESYCINAEKTQDWQEGLAAFSAGFPGTLRHAPGLNEIFILSSPEALGRLVIERDYSEGQDGFISGSFAFCIRDCRNLVMGQKT